eukprot:CAMPEP_0117419712 /NCGR_PEP_ID=MMETSP0758-20121206/1210_1 /TAXON_ID=63605 /ORGANISM="Percolomonas cosmopolitus, Strain AE-1 (ATCC 50343)" /LENGTH=511 /DNA_ID=CAMNT_0005200923 /DNA_START=352 /DNA_END=1887 /DNA_ORIENTATION=-
MTILQAKEGVIQELFSVHAKDPLKPAAFQQLYHFISHQYHQTFQESTYFQHILQTFNGGEVTITSTPPRRPSLFLSPIQKMVQRDLDLIKNSMAYRSSLIDHDLAGFVNDASHPVFPSSVETSFPDDHPSYFMMGFNAYGQIDRSIDEMIKNPSNDHQSYLKSLYTKLQRHLFGQKSYSTEHLISLRQCCDHLRHDLDQCQNDMKDALSDMALQCITQFQKQHQEMESLQKSCDLFELNNDRLLEELQTTKTKLQDTLDEKNLLSSQLSQYTSHFIKSSSSSKPPPSSIPSSAPNSLTLPDKKLHVREPLSSEFSKLTVISNNSSSPSSSSTSPIEDPVALLRIQHLEEKLSSLSSKLEKKVSQNNHLQSRLDDALSSKESLHLSNKSLIEQLDQLQQTFDSKEKNLYDRIDTLASDYQEATRSLNESFNTKVSLLQQQLQEALYRPPTSSSRTQTDPDTYLTRHELQKIRRLGHRSQKKASLFKPMIDTSDKKVNISKLKNVLIYRESPS